MTPKQMAVASLRSLNVRCLREQAQLKMIRAARSSIERDEQAAYARIKQLKQRIDRELIASASLLGITPQPSQED